MNSFAKRTLVVAAGAVLTGILSSSAMATPMLIVDLVASGTSSKQVTVSSAGQVVQLDLLAKVKDNTTGADGMLQVTGAIADTGVGEVPGTLGTALIAPFNDAVTAKLGTSGTNFFGSANVLDVGAAQSATTGFYIPSTGTTANTANFIGEETIGADHYKIWKVGSISFTAGTLPSSGETELNYLPRNNALVSTFFFTSDGLTVTKKFSAIGLGEVSLGSPVVVAVPEPASLGLVSLGALALLRRKRA